MRFVISEDVVHIASCKEATKPEKYATAIPTIEAMLTNLARVDVRDNHSAPARVTPCSECLIP